MLVPAVVSADLCVVMPREGSMLHRAVVAWVQVAGEGLGAACASDPAIVGTRPPVLCLNPQQLAEFCVTGWVPLLTDVRV